MNNLLNHFIDASIQCWGCPLFDRLFQIISISAEKIYTQFVHLCFVLFGVLFTIVVVNAVWQHIKPQKPDTSDPMYVKSVGKIIMNSAVALSILGMGVMIPKFVTRITFEPAADIALMYTQTMLKTSTDTVEQHVTYQPVQITNEGLFRPQLRDKIVLLMKTTIIQFQSYMKLGLAVMDHAFSWTSLLTISSFFENFILFMIGAYLFYQFFKLFFRFCCYFADIIIAMAFFAFFFPISLMMMSFKDATGVPGWLSSFGKEMGANQIKKLINAIITLATAVITYTIIMVIIAKFFSSGAMPTEKLMELITTGEIYADALSNENIATLTLTSAIILVYVLNFIYSQIPQISKMILSAFDVNEENKLSEQLANDTESLLKATKNKIFKKIGDAITGKEGASK